MSDFAIRSIVPDDAEAIAIMWLICTAEVAENEPNNMFFIIKNRPFAVKKAEAHFTNY